MITDENNIPVTEEDTSPVEDFEEVTENQEETPIEETQDDTLEKKLESLQGELQEEKDKYLRLFAEFQNFRNRTTKEKTEVYNNAITQCVKELLPIVDTFELALAQESSDEKYKSGVENIFKKFKDTLEKLGVKEIDALGKEFDPNVHHAIQQGESDEYESNTICQVFQKGYMLGERLIRPAMVKVVE